MYQREIGSFEAPIVEAIRTIQRLSAEIKLNHSSQEKLSIKDMVEEGRR